MAAWGLGTPAFAQSVTAGGLRGTVHDADGAPLAAAAVTIENPGGGVVRNLTSGADGTFAVHMMSPGTYNLLVEVVGFQPVRLRGAVVASGRTTAVAIQLESRPPPITSVTELSQSGTTAGPVGRIVMEQELHTLAARWDATDLSRGVSDVAAPLDGRAGFALAASGLPGRMTRIFVDGVPEIVIRHPGVPDEPAATPVFQRDAIAQGQISGGALDAEWRGNPGSVLSLITRSGTNRFEFAPYAAGSSAKLGGNSVQNPADSSGNSFWLGAVIRGAVKPDTAHFFFQGSYQSLQTPTPYPWEQDEATYGGATVSLRQTLPAIGTDQFSTSLASAVAPVVRTWKGGSGLGRLDWRLSGNSQFMLRASLASFKEANPLIGFDVGNEAGSTLEGRDLSTALSFTTIGVSLSNEVRAGLSMARRNWRASDRPATRLVAEAIRFGGSAVLPGLFESQMLSFSDALQYQKGAHALKGGVSLDYTSYRQEYDYGSAGGYLFGDLDEFGSARGVFFRTVAQSSEVKLSVRQVGVFLQDTWRMSPGLDFLFGLRYETQILPRNKIAGNVPWTAASGIESDSVPRDRRGIQPRVGFVLAPGNRGDWIIQAGVGLYASGLDLASFAEAVHNSGSNVKVRRGAGTFDAWPALPSAALSPEADTRLTMFSAGRAFRAPRTLKGDLAITRALQGGLTLELRGAYHHSDFLLRRTDLNLSASPSGQTQDGRPVYGTLIQQGGLVAVASGTSRRFPEFDLVSGLAPTGFSDHYEVTMSVNRPVGRRVSLAAEYTYSRTRDNLVGLREPDPADQLSPFPGGITGVDWDEGRSDLDIPHRAAATIELRGGGRNPISVAVRGRWRSGLPFTPGFRSGVDVNGDLGGNNDPAPSDAVASPSGSGAVAICEGTSVGGFALRNSCRESGVGSLDLRLGWTLPVGGRGAGSGRLALTVDAFNLVASTTGVVDRAAVLIDPTKTLSSNPASGAVTIPLVANPRFGTLLSRRGEPRTVRLGLRVEY